MAPVDSFNLQPPALGPTRPVYPHLLQSVRVTDGVIPGPSNLLSSTTSGQLLYLSYVQQLVPSTLLPRDREPCLVIDLNGNDLGEGYYNARLAGSYGGLPLFEVGGSAPVCAPTDTRISCVSVNWATQVLTVEYQTYDTCTKEVLDTFCRTNPTLCCTNTGGGGSGSGGSGTGPPSGCCSPGTPSSVSVGITYDPISLSPPLFTCPDLY